jgi:hypothetical protein
LLALRDFQVVLEQLKDAFIGALIWDMDEGAIDIKKVSKLDNFIG